MHHSFPLLTPAQNPNLALCNIIITLPGQWPSIIINILMRCLERDNPQSGDRSVICCGQRTGVITDCQAQDCAPPAPGHQHSIIDPAGDVNQEIFIGSSGFKCDLKCSRYIQYHIYVDMYQYDSASYPVIVLITSLLLESLNYHIQTCAMLPRWWSMVGVGRGVGESVSVDVVGLYPDNTETCVDI